MGYGLMKLWRVVGFLCLLGCAHAPEASPLDERSPATALYTVTIADNFSGASVRVCLDGASARELVPIGDDEGHTLRGAWIAGDTLETARGRIRLREPSRASCVDYETRFEPPMLRASDPAAIVVSQTQWLWRPDPFPPDLRASIRFVLPMGAQVSLPWPSSGAIYFPEKSAFFTGAFAVFGSFERQSFSVASTRVDVARVGPRPTDDHVRRWLSGPRRSVGSLAIGSTSSSFLLQAERNRWRSGWCVEAAARRCFCFRRRMRRLISSKQTGWRFTSFRISGSPICIPRDRWLSEGIATYLQEVLRARCGLQTGRQAWTRLHEGFERGRRSGTGRDLASESRSMNRTGAYHRVYWAGAAFALEADVRLREHSNGNMTLLCAINDAQRAWGTEARPVEASVLLRALQEASGMGFIEELGKKYAASADFPGTVYVDSPEYREIRSQIMSGAHEACRVSAESSR